MVDTRKKRKKKAEKAVEKTRSSLEYYREWKERFRFARSWVSWGAGGIWLLLTLLVAYRIVLSFHGLANDGQEVTLAGIFVAWMTLTTAIHRALKPFRGRNGESRIGEGVVDLVADGVEEGVDRKVDSSAP